MTEKVFTNQYWIQYLMIEKEFKTTIRFLAVDSLNFKAFSNAYAKLLLEIGSEVDVVAKEICREIDPSSKAETINQYQSEIIARFPEFLNVTVACDDINLCPWLGWGSSSPEWWKIYNGVKHNRNKKETYGDATRENYRFANQETVLNALAGLYQLELYLYSLLQHIPLVDTPLPGSRLFKLKDQGWEQKHFGQEVFAFQEKGGAYFIEADRLYSDI